MTRDRGNPNGSSELRHRRHAPVDELLHALAAIRLGRIDVPLGIRGDTVHGVELTRLASAVSFDNLVVAKPSSGGEIAESAPVDAGDKVAEKKVPETAVVENKVVENKVEEKKVPPEVKPLLPADDGVVVPQGRRVFPTMR